MQRVILTTLLCMIPSMAMADTPPAFTEDSIRAFYKQSADILKHDFTTYLDFTEKSLHKDMQCTSQTIVIIPGQTPVSQKETLNKTQILANAQQVYESMKDSNLTNNVVSITFHPDRLTADVRDETTIYSINMGGVMANAQGECNDVVTMAGTGNIQMLQSNCRMEISVLDPNDANGAQ